MRRQCVLFALLALLAGTPTVGSPANAPDPVAVTAMVAIPSTPLQSTGLREEAGMILVGSALIGLAAVIRRTA